MLHMIYLKFVTLQIFKISWVTYLLYAFACTHVVFYTHRVYTLCVLHTLCIHAVCFTRFMSTHVTNKQKHGLVPKLHALNVYYKTRVKRVKSDYKILHT